MTTSNSPSNIGRCMAVIVALLIAAPASRAQSEGAIPPPLSYPRAQYYMNNPQAWSQFLSELPQGAAAQSDESTLHAVPPTSGGTWTAVTAAPVALANPLLLTDGTVIASRVDAAQW